MLPIEIFAHFVNENRLFSTQSRILAAVSGGKDSVLMVYLLKAAGYSFSIAHCNFQLRGDDSMADEQFCRQLALQLQVPFEFIRFDTQAYAHSHHISIQMAARELRFQWFEKLRHQQQFDVVALAHHQNDTIETILLNLVRGTGIAGLHGIQAVNGQLVRPMLCFTSAQVNEYIRVNHINYREDSSNSSTKYARNKIRLEVIPHLKELNPNLEQSFRRNLEHFRELEILLQQQAEQARQRVFNYSNIDETSLSIEAIKQLHPQRLLMFELLKTYNFKQTSVDDLLSALNRHSGRVFESATHRLITDRDRILLSPKSVTISQPVYIQADDSAATYGNYSLLISTTDAITISNNKQVANIDNAKLQYPLLLRTWRRGDEFYPLGMTSRKKLSDFFINQKVPLNQKSAIPILVNGNDQIIWIAGYRVDNRYKVTPHTKKVTIFELQN